VYAALRSSAILHPRSKNEWKSEVQLPGEKGELRPYNLRIAPALRGNDAVMGFCLSISPVHGHNTNSITAPSISRVDNERWYHLLDGFEIPLWIAQKDGTIEFGNRKLRDFLGVTSDHFTRTWPLEFCHKDDVPGFVAAGARLGTNRRRIQNTAGYLKWFSESITAVKSETGEVLNYVGALVECGKERRLEEVARSLRETVNILFKTKRVVYWLHDLSKKRVTAVSAGFDVLFGISADELLIEPNIWIKVPNPHVVVPEQVSEEGSPLSYSIPNSNGSSVPVKHTIYPLHWDDGVDGERFYIHVVEPTEPF
jgi:PAS domain-containing protein